MIPPDRYVRGAGPGVDDFALTRFAGARAIPGSGGGIRLGTGHADLGRSRATMSTGPALAEIDSLPDR